MIRRAILPAALAALLASCAAPDIRPAATAVTGPALGLQPAAAPLALDAQWWRAFGDPQLDRIVADATAGNPSLDQALARLRQAEAVLGRQRADRRPQVTGDVEPQVSRLSGVYVIPPPYAGTVRFVGTATANLDWNLDLFGRQRAAIRQVGANAEAARIDIAAARLAVAGSTVQAYVDLARAEAQARIAQETIAARRQSLRLVDVQVRNRLASKLQATAAQTLLAQAQEALTAAQGERALAADALAALAGRGPDYAAGIGATRLSFDAALPLPATVPLDLLSRRPDLLAAQARIAAASAGRQVAQKAYYPNVNLSGLGGFEAIGLGNLFSLAAGTVGIGPAIHLPIFDGGRLRSDLQNATGALDLAVADYNDRVIGAVRDAADAIASVSSLQAQRARSREVVAGFAETNRLNAVRVQAGLDSKLDLVDADVRLLDAQLQDINLAADAARQRAALAVALGGGFTPSQDTPR